MWNPIVHWLQDIFRALMETTHCFFFSQGLFIFSDFFLSRIMAFVGNIGTISLGCYGDWTTYSCFIPTSTRARVRKNRRDLYPCHIGSSVQLQIPLLLRASSMQSDQNIYHWSLSVRAKKKIFSQGGWLWYSFIRISSIGSGKKKIVFN